MAAVAQSAVTIIRTYDLGDRQDKQVNKVVIAEVVLSAQGGTAGDIPAALFGLSGIYSAFCIRAIDGSSALAWVEAVVEGLSAGSLVGGTGVLICDPENATDATRGNPTNYTGTVRLRIEGYNA